MSVIYRLTITFICISLVVFIVGGVITYQVMEREVDVEQRLFLQEREQYATRFVERNQPQRKIFWNKLTIEPIDSAEQRQTFLDTLVMHSNLDRMEPHLKLVSEKKVGEGWYRFEIFDVIVESDDIVDGVVESLITMYLILFGSVVILALISSSYLLRPFKGTLSLIQGFSLDSPEKVEFPRSRVLEFRQLNEFLSEMTDKVRSDYRSLKEFSENASHEIQTPIAVVQGKLDLLIQDTQLTEDQLMLVTSAQSSLHHLKRLGKALALLTKLDNKEFIDEKQMNIGTSLQQVIHTMEDLAEMKNLQISVDLEQELLRQCNEVLIEILFTNLMSNAIKHNIKDGFIRVQLDGETLTMENSGKEDVVPSSEIFQRFKKGSASDSLGLGMAIVKKICDYYNWQISYQTTDHTHRITIFFAKN